MSGNRRARLVASGGEPAQEGEFLGISGTRVAAVRLSPRFLDPEGGDDGLREVPFEQFEEPRLVVFDVPGESRRHTFGLVQGVVTGTEPFGEYGLETLRADEERDGEVTTHLVEPSQVVFDSGCGQCRAYARTGGPGHRGSPRCQSHGVAAPGGYRTHCTCDTCF